jgi:hypothetical protein
MASFDIGKETAAAYIQEASVLIDKGTENMELLRSTSYKQKINDLLRRALEEDTALYSDASFVNKLVLVNIDDPEPLEDIDYHDWFVKHAKDVQAVMEEFGLAGNEYIPVQFSRYVDSVVLNWKEDATFRAEHTDNFILAEMRRLFELFFPMPEDESRIPYWESIIKVRVESWRERLHEVDPENADFIPSTTETPGVDPATQAFVLVEEGKSNPDSFDRPKAIALLRQAVQKEYSVVNQPEFQRAAVFARLGLVEPADNLSYHDWFVRNAVDIRDALAAVGYIIYPPVYFNRYVESVYENWRQDQGFRRAHSQILTEMREFYSLFQPYPNPDAQDPDLFEAWQLVFDDNLEQWKRQLRMADPSNPLFASSNPIEAAETESESEGDEEGGRGEKRKIEVDLTTGSETEEELEPRSKIPALVPIADERAIKETARDYLNQLGSEPTDSVLIETVKAWLHRTLAVHPLMGKIPFVMQCIVAVELPHDEASNDFGEAYLDWFEANYELVYAAMQTYGLQGTHILPYHFAKYERVLRELSEQNDQFSRPEFVSTLTQMYRTFSPEPLGYEEKAEWRRDLKDRRAEWKLLFEANPRTQAAEPEEAHGQAEEPTEVPTQIKEPTPEPLEYEEALPELVPIQTQMEAAPARSPSPLYARRREQKFKRDYLLPIPPPTLQTYQIPTAPFNNPFHGTTGNHASFLEEDKELTRVSELTPRFGQSDLQEVLDLQELFRPFKRAIFSQKALEYFLKEANLLDREAFIKEHIVVRAAGTTMWRLRTYTLAGEWDLSYDCTQESLDMFYTVMYRLFDDAITDNLNNMEPMADYFSFSAMVFPKTYTLRGMSHAYFYTSCTKMASVMVFGKAMQVVFPRLDTQMRWPDFAPIIDRFIEWVRFILEYQDYQSLEFQLYGLMENTSSLLKDDKLEAIITMVKNKNYWKRPMVVVRAIVLITAANAVMAQYKGDEEVLRNQDAAHVLGWLLRETFLLMTSEKMATNFRALLIAYMLKALYTTDKTRVLTTFKRQFRQLNATHTRTIFAEYGLDPKIIEEEPLDDYFSVLVLEAQFYSYQWDLPPQPLLSPAFRFEGPKKATTVPIPTYQTRATNSSLRFEWEDSDEEAEEDKQGISISIPLPLPAGPSKVHHFWEEDEEESVSLVSPFKALSVKWEKEDEDEPWLGAKKKNVLEWLD